MVCVLGDLDESVCRLGKGGVVLQRWLVAHGLFIVHPGDGCPAASVCRQPKDLHSSACGTRWPLVRRLCFQSSRPAGPGISKRRSVVYGAERHLGHTSLLPFRVFSDIRPYLRLNKMMRVADLLAHISVSGGKQAWKGTGRKTQIDGNDTFQILTACRLSNCAPAVQMMKMLHTLHFSKMSLISWPKVSDWITGE